MDPRGESHIHQLPGTLGSLGSSEMFCQGQKNLTTHLKMDSMSALTYINKLGGNISPQLNNLAKELWLWCMERSILLKAQHLAGVLNTIADDESREMKDWMDWKLHVPRSLPANQSEARPSGDRPVFQQVDLPTEAVWQLETYGGPIVQFWQFGSFTPGCSSVWQFHSWVSLLGV